MSGKARKVLVPACVAPTPGARLRYGQKGAPVPFGIVSKPLRTWLNAPRPPEHGSACPMQLTAGITKANTGLEGISWNILGQTYVPKSINEQSFPCKPPFPPETSFR